MYLRPGENGPLFYTLLHGWLIVAGTSDFAVRFASVIASVLTVPLLYALGSKLFGRGVGLAAAALLVADPYHLWYAQEAKMYAAVAFVAALSVWLLLLALDSTGWRPWLAWLAVLGAGFYLHFFVALLIAAEAIAVVGLWRGGLLEAKRGAMLLLGLALLYVPLGLWEIPALVGGLTTGYAPYAPDALLSVLLAKFSLGLQAPTVLATLLFAFLLVAGLTLPDSADKARSRIMLAGWLVLPILLYLVVSLRVSLFLDRYLIVVLPAYVLLLGRGLVEVLRRSTIAASVAVLGIALLWAPEIWSPPLLKQDFKRAAAYVSQHASPGDVVAFLPSWESAYFDYYNPVPYRSVAVPPVDGLGLPAAIAVTSHSLEKSEGTLWLISVEPEYSDRQRQLQAWLDHHAALVEDAPLANLDVRRYRGPVR
jgi:mannosyltransferase